jgi:single-strand DNA-binding protein
MNHVSLIGRLTRDPDVRSTQNGEQVARYTLAVDRSSKDKSADFISCVTFGKAAEFAAKYLTKGLKIGVEGRIQTGSYTNKDGQKVYTTDVVVSSHTFCEKAGAAKEVPDSDGFVHVPEGNEEELPF